MEGVKKMKSKIVNLKKYSVFIILIIIVGTLLTLLTAFYFKSQIVIPVGIFFFWVGPLIIQKKIANLFLSEIEFSYTKNSFLFEEITKSNIGSKNLFKIEEIESFKIVNSIKEDASSIKILLHKNEKFVFNLLNQRKNPDSENIPLIIYNLIKDYNSKQLENKRITLIPNFFATQKAKSYIIILTIIMIGVLIMQIVIKPKTIPFTLFAGIFIYLQIIAQRKRDLRDYKEFLN